MQLELFDRRQWQSRHELAAAMCEWIECFYTAQRRDSSIGMLSPVDYETTTAGMINTPNPSGTTGQPQAQMIADKLGT